MKLFGRARPTGSLFVQLLTLTMLSLIAAEAISLLRAFVERPQRVLTRDQLLEFARGPDSDAFDRAIDVQISRLRRKLDDGGGGHDLIRTIRNEGYMFTAKVKRT